MMRNKKGFTIVELLAVLVVLAVVITIATLSISRILKKNKEKALSAKEEIILKQAKQYAQDKEEMFENANKRYGNYACFVITVNDLITNGYLDSKDKAIFNEEDDVINPVNNESMKNRRIILYIKSKEKPSSVKYNTVGIYNGPVISMFDNDNQASTLCRESTNSVVGEFVSTSNEVTYTVGETGLYSLEVWGAQGGGDSQESGGYGAYAYVEVNLTEGQVLYINIGSQGNGTTGGHNGGGNAGTSSQTSASGFGGGGATHIATKTGLLTSLSSDLDKILVVAAGGGGAGVSSAKGGAGGGVKGVNGVNTQSESQNLYFGTGATQTDPGYVTNYTSQKGSFGKGANFYQTSASGISSYGGAGGGGGLYGGGGSCRTHAGAGGGSSYIGNNSTDNGVVYCYNCSTSSSLTTRTVSTKNHSSQPIPRYAKMGDGYAKITRKNIETTDAVKAENLYYSNSETHTNCKDVQCMLDLIARMIS